MYLVIGTDGTVYLECSKCLDGSAAESFVDAEDPENGIKDISQAVVEEIDHLHSQGQSARRGKDCPHLLIG